MTFKDLHIIQQINLLAIYGEGVISLHGNWEGESYYDKEHDVTIPLRYLKQWLSQSWIIFDESVEKDLSLHFEVSTLKGMDMVQCNFSRIITRDPTTYENYDQFGLMGNYLITGSIEDEFNKMKCILEPFSSINESVTKLVEVLDILLDAIEMVNKLPSEFYQSVHIDVPASIVLKRISITMLYHYHNNPPIHRRHTPIMELGGPDIFRIFYEKPGTPEMVIKLRQSASDITVETTSSSGVKGGGCFEMTSGSDITEMINTSVNMMTLIVEDQPNHEELKPLLKRFLQYYAKSSKHIKNSIRL